MNTDVPPPIPNTGVVLRTYLGAVLFLLPAFMVWSFSSVFLFPKLEMIWHQAGLVHSRAQWLLDTSRLFKDNGRMVFAAVILLFVALEIFSHTWPRYRWRVVVSTVFVLNTAVLVGLTTLCISAFLAVPIIIKTP